jgi:hypothetical protein
MTRNALDGKIFSVRRGLAIYKVKASPFWRVRVWIPSKKKRVVKTTKATTRVEAIQIAEEFLSSLGTKGYLNETPIGRTFEHFADKIISNEKERGQRGEISPRLWQTTQTFLRNADWGLLTKFASMDVGEIRPKDFNKYVGWVQNKFPEMSPSTINHIASTFSKVMKLASLEGVIDEAPKAQRIKRKDNPRPFFRFHPLVDREHDEYQKILSRAKKMAQAHVRVRETVVTDELYDFIMFLMHSFVRPTESEIYALTHRDIAVAENPKRLIVTVRKGKTGHRVSNTMEAAVSVFERIKRRNESAGLDDFLFLPTFKNRAQAKRIFQRQFNELLESCDLKRDRFTGAVHTVYSLRHTAICMRLVLSEGKVNIFNLARNAGTSVDQIERFYARNLPQSAEMARNLQSFGDR